MLLLLKVYIAQYTFDHEHMNRLHQGVSTSTSENGSSRQPLNNPQMKQDLSFLFGTLLHSNHIFANIYIYILKLMFTLMPCLNFFKTLTGQDMKSSL